MNGGKDGTDYWAGHCERGELEGYGAGDRIGGQPVGIVDVLVSCQAAVDRLPEKPV